MKLSDAVDAILETWSGSAQADLDANSEYLRGEVELIVELGRHHIDDDLGIFATICERHGGPWGQDPTCERCTTEEGDPAPDPGGDSGDWREALTEHIRKKVQIANESFADVAARQGWDAERTVAVFVGFVEAMVPVYTNIKGALVAYAQDVANQEKAS